MQRILHTSFESHADGISDVDLDARMLRLYEPYWLMHRLQDGPVSIQHAVEGSGFLTEGAINTAGWGLLMQSEGEPMLVNGKHLTADGVAILPPGAEFRFVGQGPTVWTSVFVPFRCSASETPQINHSSVTVAAVPHGLPRILSKRIQQHLAYIETGNTTDSEFGEGVLTDALSILEATSETSMHHRRRSLRKNALASAVDIVRNSNTGLLSVQDLATAAGVSDRTLLSTFRQHLGVTPQEYLLIDRLHRARGALKSSDFDNTTVASVAARFGFLDFGRFAAKYRRLFGELPSATLRTRGI